MEKQKKGKLLQSNLLDKYKFIGREPCSTKWLRKEAQNQRDLSLSPVSRYWKDIFHISLCCKIVLFD